MSKLKNIFIVLLSLYLGWLLFGGVSFRQFVSYRAVHERNYYPFSFDHVIQSNKTKNPENIIDRALEVTSEKLSFTFNKCDKDPDKLLKSKRANCVGYAAFFSATCNKLFEQNKMNDWSATPMVAQIYLFGVNVHPFISSPFFKDHDFVKIENNRTGERFFVDPSLYDYTGIERVRGK